MRKSIFLFSFVFIFIFGVNSAVFSDDFSDTTSITWEKVKEPFFNKWNPFGVGARAIGMGQAFTAIADDASAVYYNPAGLAQLDHNELAWTGGSYYKDMPFTNFASCNIGLGSQYLALSYMKLYHSVGLYPDGIYVPVNGSAFYSTGSVVVPGNTAYPNWTDLNASQQKLLGDMYRKYINLPFQEDQVVLTYATPLTADKAFNFGLNVKYEFADANLVKLLGDDYDAWAWALDIGFLYKLRLIEHLKDFNIGIMLRDVSGRVKYYNSGVEKELYFTSTVAMSIRTTELIEKEITSFSVDWDAVNDAGVFDSDKNRLKFGFEQWFMNSHFAVRGGLIDPMTNAPWQMSLGVSARYIIGIDYAFVHGLPFDKSYDNEGDSHWVSLYWMWGKVKRTLPTPDVFASVEPISFAPKNGETAMFKLNAVSTAGIDRWVLNILDKDNNLVKTYVDIGLPPSQLVWNGTDNKYQLLPDGEYTFVFEATDKLGSTSSTPVQTVKIFTPAVEGANPKALDELRKLLNQIKDREEGEDAALANNMKKELNDLKKSKEKPTPVNPPAPAILPGNPYQAPAAQQATTTASPISIVGFPNIDSSSIKSAYIATLPDGTKEFAMDYTTDNTIPQYVMKEMGFMVKSIAESLGVSVDRIGVNAVYGTNNNMNLSVPIAQAQNYSRGVITIEQMLRGASVSLNGEAIYPNF